MKTYFAYKMRESGTLRVYLAKTPEDEERVINLLQDRDTYETINSFSVLDNTPVRYHSITRFLNKIVEQFDSNIRFCETQEPKNGVLTLNLNFQVDPFVDIEKFTVSENFYAIFKDILNTLEFEYEVDQKKNQFKIIIK